MLAKLVFALLIAYVITSYCDKNCSNRWKKDGEICGCDKSTFIDL